MRANLTASVYTADRGYRWSNVPPGLSEDELNRFVNLATQDAEESLAAGSVLKGVVADDRHAAAFSVRTLTRWDSEGRDALYAALVLFPCALGGRIDAADLLADAFFETVTRTPADTVDYRGGDSAEPPLDAPGRLLSRRRIDGGFDPHAVGAMLSRFARHAETWRFLVQDDGLMSVESGPWKPKPDRFT